MPIYTLTQSLQLCDSLKEKSSQLNLCGFGKILKAKVVYVQKFFIKLSPVFYTAKENVASSPFNLTQTKIQTSRIQKQDT
jgi:hypothetical protein